MAYLFGAHLSIVGGYDKAIESIKNKGGNCLQIFSTSPRSWHCIYPTSAEIKRFIKLKKKLSIEPIYFHASYLINLADEGEIGRRSTSALITELKLAAKLKIHGSIVHLGSFKLKDKKDQSSFDKLKNNYQVLFRNINAILTATPSTTLLIIENAGTHKIGQKLEEIAFIIKNIANPRVRVCLDTCHLHAAGYDLKTQKKLDAFLKKFHQLIGLERLELFHINDSRDPLGALRDRHENLGQGHVGEKVFRLILAHQAINNRPFIIETPGFNKKGPDEKNLMILKNLARQK